MKAKTAKKKLRTQVNIFQHMRRLLPSQGFTLIELLVVIALIGILSAVIIGGLNASRDKGKNTRAVAQVGEYVKALELYYADHGTYPLPGGGVRCIGQYEARGAWGVDECQGQGAPVIGTLTELDPYMPQRPEGNEVQLYGESNRGEVYAGKCSGDGYQIIYFLAGLTTDCGKDKFIDADDAGTVCLLEGGNHTYDNSVPTESVCG